MVPCMTSAYTVSVIGRTNVLAARCICIHIRIIHMNDKGYYYKYYSDK